MDTGVITIPVSVIIPTANRESVLKRTIQSVLQQNVHPSEIIVIDASDETTPPEASYHKDGIFYVLLKAEMKGAALQRIQGLSRAKYPFILFMDDDIILEEYCIEKLWNGLNDNILAGGVNAFITNQYYHTPGSITNYFYQTMHGKKLDTYAGMCIGPAWNLLPAKESTGILYNEVDWLNTTCTLYRKVALPDPLFSSHFQGYSLLEDVALSLTIGKNWKLYNIPSARIFHDSQPGAHKNSVYSLAKMELINRFFIMKNVMGRSTLIYKLKLILFETWGIAASLKHSAGWKNLVPVIMGKLAAIPDLIRQR